MSLYRHGGTNMPQMAQAAMSSATQAMGHQQRQTTTTREEKTNFWDDLYKGARAVQAGAGAVNSIAGAAGKTIDLYDRIKIRDAYNNISRLYADGGYEAVQADPDAQDYWHSQAMGKFVQDRAQSRKGFVEMMQKSDEMADKMYQDWRIQAMSVADAWEKGDSERYMAGMKDLVAASPLPYRLEPDENGNFRELFRSDEKGGWTATGRTITGKEAFEQMAGVLRGERMVLRGADMKVAPVNELFNRGAARYMFATMRGNAENRIDPQKQIPLYDANGNAVGLGVIQNSLQDYSGEPQIFAYGKNGARLGVFDGWDKAMQAGLMPFGAAKGRQAGGRASGGGKAAAGGNPEGDRQTESGMYQVSRDDRKEYKEYATKIDPVTGEAKRDYALEASLVKFQERKGCSPLEGIALHQKGMEKAINAGIPKERASNAAMEIMLRNTQASKTGQTGAGGNQPQAKQTMQTDVSGNQSQTGATQTAGQQAGAPEGEKQKESAQGKRIRDAAARKTERPDSLHRTQETVYRGIMGIGEEIEKAIHSDARDYPDYPYEEINLK